VRTTPLTPRFLRTCLSLCIGASLITFGLTASARAEVAFAPGAWYTEGVENGDYIQAFVSFRPDGTFEKFLRTLEECKVRAEWVERGNWTLANSQLQFITTRVDKRTIDPSDEYYINTFLVTPLDNTHVKIFDLETLLTWKLEGADVPFKFPEPQGCVVA
jgi:hypothetical protein